MAGKFKTMSRILKLYERSLSKQGQSDDEFELSKAMYKAEVQRTGLQVCVRKDGSLFSRKLKKRIDTTASCPVCQSKFKMSSGYQIKHNYGGTPKKILVCSTDCKDAVLSILSPKRVDKGCAILG